MRARSLDTPGWTIHAVNPDPLAPREALDRDIPAIVPGCVHLDLIRAGLIPHPDRTDDTLPWIGRTGWRYTLHFDLTPGELSHERTDLVFGSLDTLALITLNATPLGRAANAFHPHRFDARDAVRPGRNTLVVELDAPVPAALDAHARLPLPHNGDELGWLPFHTLRKPASDMGWDFLPPTCTSGITGPVRLECWDTARIASLRPLVSRLDARRWVVDIDAELEHADPARPSVIDIHAHLDCPHHDGSRRAHAGLARAHPSGRATHLRIPIDDPALWFPRGMGARPLASLRIDLFAGARALDTCDARVAFRTIRLDQRPDDAGSAFTLVVNDRPVFCRGANWTPTTLLPGEPSPVRALARLAADANMNMLRVWGGGRTEPDEFYDTCDELGILVWQDFMFACALYPETPDLLSSVEREARWQVARLCAHPSVALWCGGNECVWGYQRWGWKERLASGTPWGARIWLDLLPRVVAELDPTRPYWPNSPWSGAPDRDTQDDAHGDRHTWDREFEGVRAAVPRFVSEFGRVAPACERTLDEGGARTEADTRLRMTGGATAAYARALADHFLSPADRALNRRAWIWQTQVLQARALAAHIEWLRAHTGLCMGSLVWQHHDAWTCQSWSLIDSRGRPKPAWYGVRRAFAPRLLTIQPSGEDRDAILVNDTDGAVDGACLVRRVSLDGRELARAEARLIAGGRSLGRLTGLGALVGAPEDPTGELLAVECAGLRALWAWAPGRVLRDSAGTLAARIVPRDGRVIVCLSARAVARDVVIAADLLGPEARASDNFFTMFAGERVEIAIEGAAPGAAARVAAGELARSASGPATAWL